MAPLSPNAAGALKRLHLYRPPHPSIYNAVPLSRRAAVLILLFADRRGDLRVVLTLRSSTLRTFAGQVALPGGRADFLTETPTQTARREAWEEIGLPLDDGPNRLPPPFSVEYITELPCTLAKTHLVVRPVVAFLKDSSGKADVEDMLKPRVQAAEVASVFTVPLERFLGKMWCDDVWYKGTSFAWNGHHMRGHSFEAPVWEKATMRTYTVWGMTARIMVDLAKQAYARDPDFESDAEIGDEHLIQELVDMGQMKEKIRKPDPDLEPEEAKEEQLKEKSNI